MASSDADRREARSAKRAARDTETEDTALLHNTLDMLESRGFSRQQIATAAMDVERETQPYDSHAEVVTTEQGNFTMVIDVLFRSEAEDSGRGARRKLHMVLGRDGAVEAGACTLQDSNEADALVWLAAMIYERVFRRFAGARTSLSEAEERMIDERAPGSAALFAAKGVALDKACDSETGLMRRFLHALATGHRELGGGMSENKEGEEDEGEEYEGEEMDEEGRKLKNTKRRRPISAHADRPVLGTFMAAEVLNAVLSENELGPSASTSGYLQRQRGMLLECHAGIPEKVKLYDLRFSLLRRKDVTFVPPANALGPGDFDRSLDVDDDELAILDIDNLELTKKGSDASKESFVVIMRPVLPRSYVDRLGLLDRSVSFKPRPKPDIEAMLPRKSIEFATLAQWRRSALTMELQYAADVALGKVDPLHVLPFRFKVKAVDDGLVVTSVKADDYGVSEFEKKRNVFERNHITGFDGVHQNLAKGAVVKDVVLLHKEDCKIDACRQRLKAMLADFEDDPDSVDHKDLLWLHLKQDAVVRWDGKPDYEFWGMYRRVFHELKRKAATAAARQGGDGDEEKVAPVDGTANDDNAVSAAEEANVFSGIDTMRGDFHLRMKLECSCGSVFCEGGSNSIIHEARPSQGKKDWYNEPGDDRQRRNEEPQFAGGVAAEFVFAAQVACWQRGEGRAEARTLREVIEGGDAAVAWSDVQKLIVGRTASHVSLYSIAAWLVTCDLAEMMSTSQHSTDSIFCDVDLARSAHALAMPVFHIAHATEYIVATAMQRYKWATSSDLALLKIKYLLYGAVTANGYSLVSDLLMETVGIKGARLLSGHLFTEKIRHAFRSYVQNLPTYAELRLGILGSTRGKSTDDGEEDRGDANDYTASTGDNDPDIYQRGQKARRWKARVAARLAARRAARTFNLAGLGTDKLVCGSGFHDQDELAVFITIEGVGTLVDPRGGAFDDMDDASMVELLGFDANQIKFEELCVVCKTWHPVAQASGTEVESTSLIDLRTGEQLNPETVLQFETALLRARKTAVIVLNANGCPSSDDLEGISSRNRIVPSLQSEAGDESKQRAIFQTTTDKHELLKLGSKDLQREIAHLFGHATPPASQRSIQKLVRGVNRNIANELSDAVVAKKLGSLDKGKLADLLVTCRSVNNLVTTYSSILDGRLVDLSSWPVVKVTENGIQEETRPLEGMYLDCSSIYDDETWEVAEAKEGGGDDDGINDAGAEGGAQHQEPAVVAAAVEGVDASMHALLDILNPN